MISAKFRPVEAGYARVNRIFFAGSTEGASSEVSPLDLEHNRVKDTY